MSGLVNNGLNNCQGICLSLLSRVYKLYPLAFMVDIVAGPYMHHRGHVAHCHSVSISARLLAIYDRTRSMAV